MSIESEVGIGTTTTIVFPAYKEEKTETQDFEQSLEL